MMKSRHTQRNRGTPTQRDRRVLVALGRYRYLTRAQVETLLSASRRVANRRLGVLVSLGWVQRFRRTEAAGQGSGEYVYCLSASGADEVAAMLERESVPYPKLRARTPAGMEHILSIIQVWLCLDLACQQVWLEVQDFWPEWQGRCQGRRFVPLISDTTADLFDSSRTLSFRPDGVFILARCHKRSLFFLEVDCQSESLQGNPPDTLAQKFATYASYRQHGGFKRYGEEFSGFRVLTTWTSESRMQHARQAAAQLGLRQMVLFAPFSQITPATILGPIWYVPGTEETIALIGPGEDTAINTHNAEQLRTRSPAILKNPDSAEGFQALGVPVAGTGPGTE